MTTNIYLIENVYLNPSKKYVGKTVKSIEDRFDQHISNGRRLNGASKISKSLREYGKINHKITLLEVVEDSNALEREQYWIDKYNTLYVGYNIKNEYVEHKESFYHNQKSFAIKNIENGKVWNKGISVSDTTKKKISETKREKYSLGLYDDTYGHLHTEETKKLISEHKKEYYKKNRPHNAKIWIVEYDDGRVIKVDRLLEYVGGKLQYNKITKWCRENPNRFHPKEKLKVYHDC